jgi:hypothetical protein
MARKFAYKSMRTTHSRLSRARLDALLNGETDRPASLAALLDAASAPGRAEELGGLTAASTVFRTVGRPTGVLPVIAPRRRRRAALLTGLAGQAIALKLIAFAAAAAAIGGVTYAAADGHFGAKHKPNGASSTHSTAGQSESGGGDSTAHGNASGAPASPTPSMLGLCEAWLSSPTVSNHANPAYDALIARAGGRDNVNSFCAALRVSASASPHPTKSAKPSSSNTNSGKPSTHPPHPTKTHTPQGSPSKKSSPASAAATSSTKSSHPHLSV